MQNSSPLRWQAPMWPMCSASVSYTHLDVYKRQDLAHTFNQMAENIQSNDNSRGQFMGNIAHELRTPMKMCIRDSSR